MDKYDHEKQKVSNCNVNLSNKKWLMWKTEDLL